MKIKPDTIAYIKRLEHKFFLFPIIFLVLLLVIHTASTQAATYTVTNLNESGQGSLRQAIDDANGNPEDDIININVTGTVGVPTPIPPAIGSNGKLVINGPGTDLFSIRGSQFAVALLVASGADVEINNITVKDGGYNGGGAGIDTSGTLTLTDCVIDNNSGSDGGGIYNTGTLIINNSILKNNEADQDGGAIFNRGTLTLNNSVIVNNSAKLGAGIHNEGVLVVNESTLNNNTAMNVGGGINNSDGTVEINNSTLSNNMSGFGGGISQFGPGTSNIFNSTVSNNSATIDGGGSAVFAGVITFSSSTLSDNSATRGGGIFYIGTNTEVNLLNTIVANSVSGGNCYGEEGTLNARYSLIEGPNSTCINGTDEQNLTADPMLSPLADNGGPTETHALLPGSPAIDAGDPNDFPPFDQRGYIRPADGGTTFKSHFKSSRANLVPAPDIGSFELLAPTAAAAEISGRVLTSAGRSIPRAIVHITDQAGNIRTAGTNQFGYYRFKGIEVGQTLIFNVFSRRYQFETQIVNLDESITNLNFIAKDTNTKNKKSVKRE